MSKGKRLLAVVLAVAAIISVMAVTAFANNQDAEFTRFTLNSREWYYLLDAREKEDSSPVYLNLENSSVSSVRVRAYGRPVHDYVGGNSVNLTFYDGAVRSYVTCVRGTKYSISSLIYERGYPWATLGFWSTTNGAWVTGEWSADSVGSYTVARP